MRLSSLPFSVLSLVSLLSFVRAQDQNQTQGSNPSNSGQECVQALQNAGFTGLAGLFSQVNGTQEGQALLMELSSGKNYTVFAPDNEALQNVPSSVSGNNSLLAEYLSYHIVSGDFQNVSSTNSSAGGGGGVGGGMTMTSSPSAASSTQSSESSTESSSSSESSTESSSSSTTEASVSAPETPTSTAALWGGLFGRQDEGNSSSGGNSPSNSPQLLAGVWPNVTIGRTLLNASSLVSLEGNKSQVLAWTRSSMDGNVTILNQGFNGQNVTVVNSTMWRNLFVNGITGVLVPPGNLSTALTAVNATSVQNLLSTEVSSSNGTNETALQSLEDAHGVTVLVPNNEAFSDDINGTLASLQGNQSALAAILENHYLNGTTLYSTEINNNSEFVTAGGEPITFSRNDTGFFVSGSNGTSAKIVRPDVLLENGVAHIIDHVFIVESTDTSAAMSAYAAATSAAAISTTETAPITAIGGVGGGAMSTQSSGESSSSEFSASSTSSSSESSSAESSSETSSSSNTSTSGGGGGGGGQSSETASPTAVSRSRVIYQATNAASNIAVEPYMLLSLLVSVVSGIVVLSV